MEAQPDDRRIERLMASLRNGDPQAAGELIELLWPDLRRLAAAKMSRERLDHTWQPTALVNELYLELLKLGPIDSEGRVNNRDAFMGLAAHMMMRLLIHHARPLHRRVHHSPVEDHDSAPQLTTETLDDVEALLSNLAAIHPELRSVVEMKVFEGLSMQEISARLNCPLRTAERRWAMARHWLENEL